MRFILCSTSVQHLKISKWVFLCLPLYVCWLAAQESSHPLSLVVSLVRDPPPTKHTYTSFIFVTCQFKRVLMQLWCVSQHFKIRHRKILFSIYRNTNLRVLLSESYLHHWDILLWSCRLNPVGHLNHSFNQSCHILINFIIWTIQVGGGRRADLLRLQLEQWKQLVIVFFL